MTKLRIVCATAALAAMASGTALADATANIGIMSDYIYRGFYQSESTPFAGLDVETDSGFYIGGWGANVKDGLEYDIYAGYAGGGENLTWYAGLTGYYYTDDFDDTYEEVNLGFSFGFLSIDYALGNYKGAASMVYGEAQTYESVGATFAPERGPYYFIGRTDYHNIHGPNGAPRIYGSGADGYWVEIGKAFELMDGLELNVAALSSGDVPQSPSTTPSSIMLGPSCGDFDSSCTSHEAEYALVFTLTKHISIGD
jgi:hypothetical protein